MSRIKQLPPLIANQIAAGEVIERPASVVKELLENSQDAGARNIIIELGFAGLNQIKISDDGQGIYKDDLPLAIQQHATSKIACLDDLYSIQSMGFRGEALASIFSVSKLTIASRTAYMEYASKLEVENDRIIISPCARKVGTTVEVLDLFYNAPVRKNFLRGQRTELQYVEDVIKRFALGALHISITVKHNTKEILNIPAMTCAATKLMRFKKIFGSRFVNSAIEVDCVRDGMRISGLLGNIDYQRSQKDKQWIYLNNRMLRDKLLQHAVMQIYQDYLPAGRFPACLLYLDIQPDCVDVNVHPTKHEVRFKNPRDVHDFIVSSLSPHIGNEVTVAPGPKEPLFKHKALEIKTQLPDKFIVLNSKYVILFQEFEPYIVDLAKVFRDYCHAVLDKETYPLLSRPLLVPVKYAILPETYDYYREQTKLFSEFGITFDFFDKNKIIIRTAPQCLPQLDLKLFFSLFDSKRTINKVELANLIINCQYFDAKLCSEQEIYMLLAYIKNNSLLEKYSRHLSDTLCKNIFEAVNYNGLS